MKRASLIITLLLTGLVLLAPSPTFASTPVAGDGTTGASPKTTGTSDSGCADANSVKVGDACVPQETDPAVNNTSADGQCNKSGCDIVANFVNPAILVLSIIVGLAITIGIILGAIEIISSAGDPQKNAKGRGHIQNAIIAMVTYLVLFGLLKFLLPGLGR